LRPSSKCDGLSIVVFLQQPCLQYGGGEGGIAVRFAAGGNVACCILNNVLRGHQSDAVDALPNKQML